MGLNPFWLSWCYSLQISNGDREGWEVVVVVEEGMEGKVEGKEGRSHSKKQTLKLPVIPHRQEAIDGQ